jgi:hypothetical protein
MITLTGRVSWFGGPNDKGVRPSEGLAIFQSVRQCPEIFLSKQPPGTSGLARRLDPNKLYIAMRWPHGVTYSYLAHHLVKAEVSGKSALLQPADWGPAVRTRRIADLSPGAMKALGLVTDGIATFHIPEPGDQPFVDEAPSLGEPGV